MVINVSPKTIWRGSVMQYSLQRRLQKFTVFGITNPDISLMSNYKIYTFLFVSTHIYRR